MRPPGSAQALEVRRMIAVRVLQQGKGVRETARLVGASSSSVTRWKQALQSGGPDALKVKPHPGRRSKLTQGQKEVLGQILLQGPQAAGFESQLWTLERVAYVIYREFGVRYHPCHVWRILRSMGWSCQKPQRRARERDEQEIANWRKRWPEVKKSP